MLRRKSDTPQVAKESTREVANKRLISELTAQRVRFEALEQLQREIDRAHQLKQPQMESVTEQQMNDLLEERPSGSYQWIPLKEPHAQTSSQEANTPYIPQVKEEDTKVMSQANQSENDLSLDIDPNENPFALDSAINQGSKTKSKNTHAVDFLEFLKENLDPNRVPVKPPRIENDVATRAAALVEMLDRQASQYLQYSPTRKSLGDPDIPTLTEIIEEGEPNRPGIPPESSVEDPISFLLTCTSEFLIGGVLTFVDSPSSKDERLEGLLAYPFFEDMFSVSWTPYRSVSIPFKAMVGPSYISDSPFRGTSRFLFEGWFSEVDSDHPITSRVENLLTKILDHRSTIKSEVRVISSCCSEHGLKLTGSILDDLPTTTHVYNRTGILISKYHLQFLGLVDEKCRQSIPLALSLANLISSFGRTPCVSRQVVRALAILDLLITPELIEHTKLDFDTLDSFILNNPRISVSHIDPEMFELDTLLSQDLGIAGLQIRSCIERLGLQHERS